MRDSQLKGFPYLIARQTGSDGSFQQPYAEAPGIGVPPYKVPLELQSGQIIFQTWNPTPTTQEMFGYIFSKLSNVRYTQPYNNLSVNGANLSNLRTTKTYLDTGARANYFFDIVLPNVQYPYVPNFGGKSAAQEAPMLKPDIILLWIGNNDILGMVLIGCGLDGVDPLSQCAHTDKQAFAAEYRRLLSDLQSGSGARIVMAAIPAYLPFDSALDGIFLSTSKPTPTELRLCVFDPKTFTPINFGDSQNPIYLPLLLREAKATHLLLTGAIAYLGSGQGIPVKSDLIGWDYTSAEADRFISTMRSHGLQPNAAGAGTQLPGVDTITPNEENTGKDFLASYNQTFAQLSAEFDVPLVDIVRSWWGCGSETANPFVGYSGRFALQDQNTTVFSLDGVHPNNLGHALCANEFIRVMNQRWNMGIPELNPAYYKAQYQGKSIQPGSIKAVRGVSEMYRTRRSPSRPPRGATLGGRSWRRRPRQTQRPAALLSVDVPVRRKLVVGDFQLPIDVDPVRAELI